VSKKNRWDNVLVNLIAGIIVFGIMALVVGGVIVLRTKLPCSVLDWMPAKDVPTRCLRIDVR
jgi:hypothetical protein